MAAVVDLKTVEQFARPGCFEVGQALVVAGAVGEVAGAYGGASGFVAGEGGREFDVWVGIRLGELVGECDCPDQAGLCQHAVAVAVTAVQHGVKWATAPEPIPVAASKLPAPASPYHALRAGEKARILDDLVREDPELLAQVQKLAVELLSGGGEDHLRKQTATAVENALLALDVDQLVTGDQMGRGYVDECAAAGDLVAQALEPFERDVARRLALDFVAAAQEVALGVLDGLDACAGECDGDEVLGYAGDDLNGLYGVGVRELMRQGGAPLPDGD